MSNSVGRIDLDLGINSSGFKSQLNGITKTAKSATGSMSHMFGKLGLAITAAFSVKAIVNFSKQCLQLGSDLAEVQNVVDVTFGSMSEKVNDFAKDAMTSYGMSEKVAKQYMGTFGAMSKSFGYTTEAAYEQAAALTGLAGDVASFYNITTDEAYTKLKSVFTGETESLKELGVVMTQTALDEYALANSYGKTTSAMSEQEKVALRLAFVQDKLSDASGDFIRTSDGWANQTRVLSLRFDALKASIGQGLIAALTPAIKALNTLMIYLQKAADAFSNFMQAVFGKSENSSAISSAGADLAAGVGDASASSGDLADNASSAADSAAAIKKSLAGFDKLNVLGSTQSSGSSGSSGISASPEIGSVETSTNSAIGALDTFKKKLNEIAAWTGFDTLCENIRKGISKIDFSAIKTNFKTIVDGLEPIVKSSFKGIGTVSRSFSSYLGTLIGESVAIAGKQIEITTGGVAKFLNAQGGTISAWIENTAKKLAHGFDNLSFGAENIFSSFWNALNMNQSAIEASIAEALTSFSTMGMTIGTIFTDMWGGITEGFATWSEEHKEDLDTFFNDIIELSTSLSDTISQIFGDLFGTLLNWWNTSGKEIWNGIVECIYDIIGWVMELWNNCLEPVIQHLVDELNRLWNETLKPLWDKVLSFIKSIWDVIKPLWDNLLKPLLDWLIKNLGPGIKNVLNSIVDFFSDAFSAIGGVVGGIIDAFSGLLDFISGVFTGDWNKAWEGIKKFFKGIWDGIWSIIKGVINLIIDALNALWSALYTVLRIIVNGLGDLIGAIGSLFGQDWGWEIPSDPPKIPRLATGGYVAANTPQLAVIGDNKHEGEIVAPESKIAEAVAAGVAAAMRQFAALMSNNGSNKQQTPIVIKIGEDDFWSGFIDYHNSVVKRTGESPLYV